MFKLLLAAAGIMIIIIQPLAAQNAQGGIEGQVRDAATMLPLERVNISVLNTLAGAVSDLHGKYTLSGLKPGEYEIRASMVGYESLQVPVKVSADRVARIDLDLHLGSIFLDSVAITGSRPKRDLMTMPTLEPSSLINLTYNLFRDEQVMRLNILTTK